MAIAYFYTWTTYGTWLPGDQRGWLQRCRGSQIANARLEFEARLRMAHDALRLNIEQRKIVEQTITDHCAIRGWILHSINCRTNHAHVVVTAADRELEELRKQFKAWCTRKLKEHSGGKLKSIWTERGWDEYVDTEDELADVNAYVLEGQDRPR